MNEKVDKWQVFSDKFTKKPTSLTLVKKVIKLFCLITFFESDKAARQLM